ncbi:TfoX/Sxy family DNA transformation protein [Bdellovibrio svalbardensis]|uniref:TfoX/Sxy family protein n=1 Tax=Bdellovibrio svalbardensis TaxID=2972972 RepID=A0ABT6DLA4_9BACT|nr:TfoX/Sxy family DNA transformation protein [Bdellovibrio svalbardensis]MDG0817661.1 TfoX/Sxy family protein [Bdellovibrio svalbardensis]
MAKEPQELKWIESLLPDEGVRRKAMFGGFAYYLADKLVLVTFETPGYRSYRNQTYDYELWYGCMFPLEREHHEKALKQFPELTPHPILPKWLYLPLDTEGFDDLASEIMAQVIRPHSYWGSFPKAKSKKAKSTKAKSAKANAEKISTKIDTRKPRLFSDEPAESVLQSAQKISDLKNLGAVSEREFLKAGIKTAPKFIQLGWKKALVKLIKVNPKNRHSIFAYALIGALTNKEWNRISDQEKQEAREFVKSLPSAKGKAKVKAKAKAKTKTTKRGK